MTKMTPTSNSLPDVKGWRILVEPYVPSEKTAGGIWKPDAARETEEHAATCAKVLAMGPLCYKDEKYGEPWCKVGDWIIMQKWGGKRFELKGAKLRMINDDEVLGVVESPEPYYQ